MRILISSVSYPPYISGVATVASILAQGMAKENIVGVISPSFTGKEQTRTVNGVIEFRISSIGNPFRRHHRLPLPQPGVISRILSDFRPDVIHLHDPSETSISVFFMAQSRGLPVLFTQHFFPGFVTSYIRGTLFQPAASAIEAGIVLYMRTILNRCTHITTPSSAVRHLLVHQRIKTPISTISNGVDLRRFFPSKRDDDKSIATPKALYFGRVDKDKSVDELVKAASFIESSCEIVIAGDGKERERLERIANSWRLEDRVKFVGLIREDVVPDIYRSAKVFVMPSAVEAQSIATLQALATGLPVVAVKAGALPELVKHNQNGQLVPPHDPQKLALAIDKILRNSKLRKKFAEKSRAIAENHDINRTIEQYSALYKNLSATRGRSFNYSLNWPFKTTVGPSRTSTVR